MVGGVHLEFLEWLFLRLDCHAVLAWIARWSGTICRIGNHVLDQICFAIVGYLLREPQLLVGSCIIRDDIGGA